MIPSEISVSGDYLKLEGNKGWKISPVPLGFNQSNLPGVGNLTRKVSQGPGFDQFLKRTCEANLAGENAHSFLQSVSNQFHIIILSLPM